jgi:DNA-binding MarR family transcriptional regulator
VTADTPLLPELAALPGHLVWRARARVLAAVAERLPDGVDVHAYATLLALADGRARSQQALAEATKVSRTTMTRVAQDLVDRGLVERVRNPDDRRSWSLTRTAAGAATARSWERHLTALEAGLAGDLSAAENAELRALLREVLGAELPDDTPDELRESTSFLVTRTHWRMHREVAPALVDLGIEPRHLAALVALRATGPVPQAELGRRLGLSPASMVAITDDLEDRGLLERRGQPGDRRTHLLHLRPPAAATATAALAAADRSVETSLAGLDHDQRSRLLDLLQRVVTAA